MEETISFLLKLRQQGFRDTALLRAFELVPRERFAASRLADLARKDYALPLPCGQVMTAPLVLAKMFAALEIGRAHRVFEIGTGSGYGTAVLAHVAAEIVSVERFRTLAVAAQERLTGMKIANAIVIHADGLDDALPQALGKAGEGGFERIIFNGVIAAWPPGLAQLLRPGGRAVAVLGAGEAAQLTAFAADDTGAISASALGPLSMPPLRAGVAQAL